MRKADEAVKKQAVKDAKADAKAEVKAQAKEAKQNAHADKKVKAVLKQHAEA